MEDDLNLHVVFVSAFIKKGNRFLFSQRSFTDKMAPALWTIPGGKVDNETTDNILEQTLKREVLEEVNIEIINIQYLASQSFIRSSGHHVIGVIFYADYLSGEAKALEDQNDVNWITINEIENLIQNNNKLNFLKIAFGKLKDLQ